jgi:hypothetical protein
VLALLGEVARPDAVRLHVVGAHVGEVDELGMRDVAVVAREELSTTFFQLALILYVSLPCHRAYADVRPARSVVTRRAWRDLSHGEDSLVHGVDRLIVWISHRFSICFHPRVESDGIERVAETPLECLAV